MAVIQFLADPVHLAILFLIGVVLYTLVFSAFIINRADKEFEIQLNQAYPLLDAALKRTHLPERMC